MNEQIANSLTAFGVLRSEISQEYGLVSPLTISVQSGQNPHLNRLHVELARNRASINVSVPGYHI